MACKIVVMENGIHVSDPSLSPPSLGWLCPTKMSHSQDFNGPQEALYTNMTKTLDDRQRERFKESRDSMSEFEFAMSAMQNENMHGEHMLAADELFFKGKLLPLYNPDYTDGSEQQASRCDMRDRVNQQMMSNNLTSSCTLYSALDAENSQANTRDLIIPTSPKVAKCSLMLKDFFGLKRMAKSICACTSSGQVAAGSFRKSSRSGSSKKGIKTKQKASLMLQPNAPSALCKARHLSCASRDATCIIPTARHSVSEPLLACCVIHHQADCQQYVHLEKAETVLCPVCSDACDIAHMQRSNRVSDSLCTHKASHEQRLLGISCSDNLGNEDNTCRRSTGEQSRGSRRQSLQMGLGEMSESCGTLSYEKACCRCRSDMSPQMSAQVGETSPGRSSCSAALSYEEDTHRRSNGEQSRASMRMHSGQLNPAAILQRSSSYEGSTCRGLAGEQNRGSRRPPMREGSGQSSPERFSCRTMRYGDNALRGDQSRRVTTEQSRGATMVPMRIHIGETSPERGSHIVPNTQASQMRYATSEGVKTTEISRTKILERSSSYSPKSLQRKYEQLKAIRQREGWRILERSSSHNSGMQSMRVAPVLNVPIIVCMSRSKSSNHGMHTRRKA